MELAQAVSVKGFSSHKLLLLVWILDPILLSHFPFSHDFHVSKVSSQQKWYIKVGYACYGDNWQTFYWFDSGWDIYAVIAMIIVHYWLIEEFYFTFDKIQS